jgi:hypothetical protein
VSAWVTSDEIVCPPARAARRTRRASVAGSLTVNTTLAPGTSTAPGPGAVDVAAGLALRQAQTAG